jgi:hypothetical protein
MIRLLTSHVTLLLQVLVHAYGRVSIVRMTFYF